MAFCNKYELTLETADGKELSVNLRLTAMAQVELKKKYKEDQGTLDTLLDAVDDVEKMVDVLSAALKWSGNDNPAISGAELYDLMAANDLLGHVGKAEVMTSLARASGLISKETKDSIDAGMAKRVGRAFDRLGDGETPGEDTEEPSKNA